MGVYPDTSEIKVELPGIELQYNDNNNDDSL